MDEIERNARLLCEAAGENPDETILAGDPPSIRPLWHGYRDTPRRLAAAGLTLARIDPDEATVDAMAAAILEKVPEGYGMTLCEAYDYARAAYRAGIWRGER